MSSPAVQYWTLYRQFEYWKEDVSTGWVNSASSSYAYSHVCLVKSSRAAASPCHRARKERRASFITFAFTSLAFLKQLKPRLPCSFHALGSVRWVSCSSLNQIDLLPSYPTLQGANEETNRCYGVKRRRTKRFDSRALLPDSCATACSA